MIETLLRRFLDSPTRLWAVIIVTLGIGLIIILPFADEYSSSREGRAQLEELVAQTRHEVAGLEEVRRKVGEKRERLRRLEARAVAADQVSLFRQEIVDWARKAGCQVRRVRLESPRSRVWQKGDSLLGSATIQRKSAESPYVLKQQLLSVSVSGTLANIKDLFAQLHSTDRLVRSRGFSMLPSRDDRKQVVLNMELMLFDLTKSEVPPK